MRKSTLTAAGRRFPDRLGKPTPRLHRFFAAVWLICFVLVIFVQLGTAWREYVFDGKVQPIFASIGLVTVRADSSSWFVEPPKRTKQERASAGPKKHDRTSAAYRGAKKPPKLFKGRILALDGNTVVGLSAEAVADLLSATGSTPVQITMAHIGKHKGNPPETVTVTPSDDNKERVLAQADRSFKIATQILDLLLAAGLLIAGLLVRIRRFDTMINIAFAFVMVFAATVGSSRFWQFLNADQALYYFYFGWMALLLAILPAWPDGRYRPRWCRFSLVVSPLLATLLFINRKAIEKSSALSATALIVLTLPIAWVTIQRFRSEHERRDRQQLKWAFVGFGFGLICVVSGLLIPESGGWLPPSLSPAARYATFVLRRAGVLVIVAGLMLSLMRFRLNDADKVIGRSTGYAALMTGLAVVWAVGEALTDNAVKGIAGSSNQTLALSISTIVTVAILAPARERMLDWTKHHFQAGLMHLQELPQRLVRWHGNEPEAVAERALQCIVAGIDPSKAALVWLGEEGQIQPLALHNAVTDDVVARLQTTADRVHGSPLPYLFGGDPTDPPLVLLLGRRGDGASYTRQERAGVKALLGPLAEVEQSAFLRSSRDGELRTRIVDLQTRLDDLRQRPARRRNPKMNLQLRSGG